DFMVLALPPCCPPRAEDPSSHALHDEADDEKPLSRGASHDDHSSVRSGMVRVVEDALKAVAEDRQRLLERYTMLLAVGGSLPRIPLEAHVHRTAPNLS